MERINLTLVDASNAVINKVGIFYFEGEAFYLRDAEDGDSSATYIFIAYDLIS